MYICLYSNQIYNIMPVKKYHVDLTEAEKERLYSIIKNRKSESSIVKRAYVLLAADRNGILKWNDDSISNAYGVGRATVERIRERFVNRGFELTLLGKKREVFKEKIFTGDVEAKLVAMRCGSPPSGYNRWTFRLLADKMVELEYVESISHESVRQLLKKTNLSPGE